MAEPIPSEKQSMASLLGSMVWDLEKLLRQEVELIRAKIREDLDSRKASNLYLVYGLVFIIGGLFLGSSALVNLLVSTTRLPLWASYAVTAGLYLLVGGVFIAVNKMKTGKTEKKAVESHHSKSKVAGFSVYTTHKETE